jgi:hypothetical protein
MNRLYETTNDDILIGWFANGGHGCHPGLITSSMLRIIQNSIKPDDSDYWWETLAEENKIPDALICFYEQDAEIETRVEGIDSKIANSIMSIFDGDHMSTYDEDDMLDDDKLLLVNKALIMAGFIEDGEEDDIMGSVSIIPNPKINNIYWSDVPDQNHSPWEPPYKETYILEEWGLGIMGIDGISNGRLLRCMSKYNIIK